VENLDVLSVGFIKAANGLTFGVISWVAAGGKDYAEGGSLIPLGGY
jgi:hypothetical protein